MTWQQYSVAMLVFSFVSLLLTYVIERAQALLPWNPQHLAGVAPAITSAVYHATGVRVRELPVRIEDLLQSKVLEV